MAELSPMMRQYLELKEKNPACLLFFRLGDFYEMFFDDAELVSRELELTLTGRDCGLPERAPMCGVPFHAADSYIARLIEKGYRVAIAEQTEDPALARGLVRREIIRVVTPGTFNDSGAIAQKENRFLACVYWEGRRMGAALCDVSTGEFFVQAFQNEAEIYSFLSLRHPQELLSNAPERLKIPEGCCFSPLDPHYFKLKQAKESLLRHFKVSHPSALGLEERDEALICPAGALLHYLNETGQGSLQHLVKLNILSFRDRMPLPETTLKSLELTQGLKSRNSRGSLLETLDESVTAMGSRMLKSFVEMPLIRLDAIEKRLDCVEALIKNPLALEESVRLLKQVYDLERLLSRAAYNSLGPRDALALGRALDQAPEARALLMPFQEAGLQELCEWLSPLPWLSSLLSRAISPDAPVLLSDGGVIRNGYHAPLDEARRAAEEGQNWLNELEAREREKTGIKNLRVIYNRVFGYLIEVTKSNYNLVPESYTRKQTLAQAERFVTPELNELEHRILGAKEEAARLESRLFQEIREEIKKALPELSRLALGFKTLDAYQSLARAAIKGRYTRPGFNEEGRLQILGGRHPMVERSLPEGGFVPNDTLMDSDSARMLIVTGPNMAGKSTYMRETALITLMAHMGSFVPAEEAQIPLTDNVFTRIGAQDDLAGGQSTFMVEMSELSYILRAATPNSLVILDEIGRGTSTFDGLSIAWASVEYLLNKEHCGAKTLFATHYHELSELEGALQGVVNLQVMVKEIGEEVVFLRKIVKGGADKSFGVYVARLAGLPRPVLARAREILARLEANDITKDSIARNILEKRPRPNRQLGLADIGRAELIEELAGLEVLNMTPVEALNRLFVLREKARGL